MAGSKVPKPSPSQSLLRERTINGNIRRAEGENDQRYLLSFSSEVPDTRFYLPEILDHGPGAVDLTRLNEMGVVLFNHSSNQVVGKVVSAAVENSRGVAEIEFDNDDFSQTIASKVASGTLKGVSIRARAKAIEEVKQGAVSTDGRFSGPCLIYRKWVPLEISIASVPADASVGVGRSDNYQNEEDNTVMDNENSTPVIQENETQRSVPDNAVPQQVPPADEAVRSVQLPAEQENTAGQEVERQRAADIADICREFGLEVNAAEYIRRGISVEQVNREVLAHLSAQHGPASLRVQRDEGDKFRESAADSLILRAGLSLDNPAEGANNMRMLRLRDMMNLCARNDGIQNPEMMETGDLMRQFFFPSAAFPAILDNAVNKSYVQGYQTYPATFEIWTSKGQLSDFKPSRAYTLGNAGEFLLVPEGGEIKHDATATHARPDRQLKTWGRQFALTREAIYNDDISLVTTIPARYASAARRTVNRQVYNILASNPVIFDGTTLFSVAHGNLITPGTAPSLASLEAAMNRLALMKNEDGEMIYAVPKYIIVPVGLGNLFRQIIGSVTISVETGGIISSQSNPMYGRGLEIVEDPMFNTLNGNGAIEWYLSADKSSVPTIQVDYLNGNEIPTIRRMEYPSQLGYIWDIILDWGITVMDYRGIIKNEGA
ncbi:MAG: hypothetical protein ACK5LX_10280 [Oscillospiraceae bacterium]